MNLWKYVADDDHKFHRHRLCAVVFAHLVHFQFRPMHQSKLCLLAQEQSQQFLTLLTFFRGNGHGGQFFLTAVYYTGIITPPYNILLPSKLA